MRKLKKSKNEGIKQRKNQRENVGEKELDAEGFVLHF